MALDLEAALYSRYPFLISNYCFKGLTDQFCFQPDEQARFEPDKPFPYSTAHGFDYDIVNASAAVDQNVSTGRLWECRPDSSLDACSVRLQYPSAATRENTFPPPLVRTSAAEDNGTHGGLRKRRRRVTRNKEEVENQRMTHIAVERNRRKQMNEYLAVIRSLMPASHVQRGDQASIIGGAINYVKELEQLLLSLKAIKRIKKDPRNGELSSSSPLFSDFFKFPQYQTRPNVVISTSYDDHVSAPVVKIEVTMVDNHANVKILARKQPRQLLKLVDGFQRMRLSVLHLNVTTVDQLALHSFSLKVEDGSELSSTDEIAAAANHMLHQIQEEASLIHPLSCRHMQCNKDISKKEKY